MALIMSIFFSNETTLALWNGMRGLMLLLRLRLSPAVWCVRLQVTLSTHDAAPDGALSKLDLELARQMDALT